MKYLATIMLASLFGNAISQTDHFSNSESRWFVTLIDVNASFEQPSNVDTISTVFGFQGDTLINESSWLKMYSTQDSSFLQNLSFEGYIHSTGDVVEFMDSDLELDTLYNFGLQIGDSLEYFTDDSVTQFPHVLIGEQNSTEINGETYLTLEFEDSVFGFFELGEKWIQGIGSVHGPLFPLEPEIFATETPDALLLTCTYENDLNYYQNDEFEVCFMNSTGILEIEGSDISFYPNPILSSLNISSLKVFSEVQIFNQQGELIKILKFNSTKNADINLDTLSAGLYTIQIIDPNGYKVSEKIIKR